MWPIGSFDQIKNNTLWLPGSSGHIKDNTERPPGFSQHNQSRMIYPIIHQSINSNHIGWRSPFTLRCKAIPQMAETPRTMGELIQPCIKHVWKRLLRCPLMGTLPQCRLVPGRCRCEVCMTHFSGARHREKKQEFMTSLFFP